MAGVARRRGQRARRRRPPADEGASCWTTTSRPTSRAGTRPTSHVASALYDVAGFKAGAQLAQRDRARRAGPAGRRAARRLLHLQCHFGLDTLSWARRGAVVTGVDFSGEGIRTARALAAEVGLSGRATFVQSDVDEPAGQAVRLLRRRLHLLGRAHLARRPRALGRGHRPLPEAGRHLLHRRVPPLRLPARRRLHAGLAAHRLPVLPVRRAAALRRGRRLRRPRRRRPSTR